jgi:hypothetical protein
MQAIRSMPGTAGPARQAAWRRAVLAALLALLVLAAGLGVPAVPATAATGTAAVPATLSRKPTEAWAPDGSSLFGVAEGRIPSYTQRSYTIRVYNSLSSRTGRFQVWRGGKWETLQQLRWTLQPGHTVTGPQTVTSPKTSATVKRKYRLVIDGTKYEKAWTDTATVSHENPRDYTGQRKRAYGYMRAYCPNQIITVVPGWTSYAWTGSRRIEIGGSYPAGAGFRYVALHECAHIRQYALYKDNYGALAKRMNAIYGGKGGTGLERAADCMAYTMGADKAAGGTYTTKCSGSRGKAARLLLAGRKP